METVRKRFGLLGRNISYSFSKGYFTEKFKTENLEGYTYENFDLTSLDEFSASIANTTDLKGINVTIPYKEAIMLHLDSLSKKAARIGAVNTIKFTKKGKLKGYNTDYYGFKKSILPLLKPHHQRALILGTGGASKAIAFALEELGISFTFVSRGGKEKTIDYTSLNAITFDNYQIVINCTPIGTSPDVDASPAIPYDLFTDSHIAYDLIYNPEETQFLRQAKAKGATTKNGYDMLVYQAEKSWEIWNK
jgi:shikimate dehydrogenase